MEYRLKLRVQSLLKSKGAMTVPSLICCLAIKSRHGCSTIKSRCNQLADSPSDMFWMPVPTHSPHFQKIRGRFARAEKLRAVPRRAACRPAAGAWMEAEAGGVFNVNTQIQYRRTGSEIGLYLYLILITLHRSDYRNFLSFTENAFSATKFQFVVTCECLTLLYP